MNQLINFQHKRKTVTIIIWNVVKLRKVDTTRIAAGEDFLTNQQNMRMKVDKAWALILSSYPKFPPGLMLSSLDDLMLLPSLGWP